MRKSIIYILLCIVFILVLIKLIPIGAKPVEVEYTKNPTSQYTIGIGGHYRYNQKKKYNNYPLISIQPESCIVLGRCELGNKNRQFRVRISDETVLEATMTPEEYKIIQNLLSRAKYVNE